jgi:hypothetical protein
MDEHSAAGFVRADVGRSFALPRRRPVAVGDAHCPANAGAATKTAAATTSTCVSQIGSLMLSKICPVAAREVRLQTRGSIGSSRAVYNICAISGSYSAQLLTECRLGLMSPISRAAQLRNTHLIDTLLQFSSESIPTLRQERLFSIRRRPDYTLQQGLRIGSPHFTQLRCTLP